MLFDLLISKYETEESKKGKKKQNKAKHNSIMNQRTDGGLIQFASNPPCTEIGLGLTIDEGWGRGLAGAQD